MSRSYVTLRASAGCAAIVVPRIRLAQNATINVAQILSFTFRHPILFWCGFEPAYISIRTRGKSLYLNIQKYSRNGNLTPIKRAILLEAARDLMLGRVIATG